MTPEERLTTMKSVTTVDPPEFTGNKDDKTVDVEDWISRIEHKLEGNADHFPTVQSTIAYVYGCTFPPASQHLRLKIEKNSLNRFTSIEDMFETLQNVYGDTDKKHTAQVKFQDLKMTKDFDSFWAEFMLLANQIKAHESTLIIDLRQKLTPSLSRALAALPRPKKLNEYAEQCRNAYRNLSDLEKRMSKVTIPNPNRFGRNASGNSTNSTNSNARNTKSNLQNRRPVTSSYARPPGIAAAPPRAQNKNIKLSRLENQDVLT